MLLREDIFEAFPSLRGTDEGDTPTIHSQFEIYESYGDKNYELILQRKEKKDGER